MSELGSSNLLALSQISTKKLELKSMLVAYLGAITSNRKSARHGR